MPIYKMKGTKNGLQKYRVRVNYTDSTGQPRQTERVVYGSQEAKDLEKALMPVSYTHLDRAEHAASGSYDLHGQPYVPT